MKSFHYVYILESESQPGAYYTGSTEDLRARLKKHNEGGVPHTSKARPWRIKTAVVFTDAARATAFERYLKTASGRAFARKRLSQLPSLAAPRRRLPRQSRAEPGGGGRSQRGAASYGSASQPEV